MFPPSFHGVIKFMESPWNHKEIKKNMYKFSWRKICDGNRGVYTEIPRRETAFPWSSTWQMTAQSPSAHAVLRVFNSRSLFAQCTDRVHRAYLWRSDVQKDSERSSCKRALYFLLNLWFTANICVTWARQRISSGAAGYLVALLQQLHFVSTASLSEHRATARILYLLKVRAADGFLGDPTATNEVAAALLRCWGRLGYLGVLYFHGHNRIALRPQLWCDMGLRFCVLPKIRNTTHQFRQMTIHLTISRGEERSASSDTLPTLVSLSSSTRIWSGHFRLLIFAACLRIFSASSLLPRTASHRVDSGTNLHKETIDGSWVKGIKVFFISTKIQLPLLLLVNKVCIVRHVILCKY